MSYIRCLSNPEGLYIFGSKNAIEIYGKVFSDTGDWNGKRVPYEVWNGFCQGFVNEYYPEEFEFRGMSIKEEKVGSDFKMVLRYEDWEIPMWFVTWDYIIRGFKADE